MQGAENMLWSRQLRGRRPWGQGGNPRPWERAPRTPPGLREPWWRFSQVQAVGTEAPFALCLLGRPRPSLGAVSAPVALAVVLSALCDRG